MTTLALTGIRVRAAKSGRLRALRRNKLAMTGAVIAAVFVLAALFAPLVAPYDPAQPNFDNVLAAPGWSHWLGTDA
ncbi:ABC transporter permease, partial [Streptomyces sp. NPDC056728]